MTDHLVRILTNDGAVRVSVADTTLLCEEVRRRQQTDPTAHPLSLQSWTRNGTALLLRESPATRNNGPDAGHVGFWLRMPGT